MATSDTAMARLEFAKSIREAWRSEAADFTRLLAEQLDALGSEVGLDLASIGKTEVITAGERRIDILAVGQDGSEFVIENQYGRADHDHLTRGLAYAVARRARGLIVVAEEHRDEFRALAEYLNGLAEIDEQRGIAIWLVEVQAVRIAGSPWAPLFSTVAGPNSFTAEVAPASGRQPRLSSLDAFWALFKEAECLAPSKLVVDGWSTQGRKVRLGTNYVVLEALGPSANGYRTVVTIGVDGLVLVPFGSYAGQNSGIPVEPLTTPEFRSSADELFGFKGWEKQPKTEPGWLNSLDRARELTAFCGRVADAYSEALTEMAAVDVS